MDISPDKSNRPQTAFRHALARAGYSGGRDRAYVRIAQMLRDTNLDYDAVRRQALKIAQVDSDFLISVFDAFVRVVAQDMEGTALPGGGQPIAARKGQMERAPDRQRYDEDEGYKSGAREGQASSAPSSSPNEGGEGQYRGAREGQNSNAPPSSPETRGEGQPSDARKGHRRGAFSAPPDTPEQKARRAAVVARSWEAVTSLDSYKVRDGRSVGNVPWHDLERLETTSQREAWVVRQIRRHARVDDPSTLVRDVITAAQLDRIIQKAAELSDAY